MKVPPWVQDHWAALCGVGPVSSDWRWPADLQAAFPGRRRILESWKGDGASFARYHTPHGALFLKYLPAGERKERYFRRFQREISYLRDLGPLGAPHVPLLHAALDEERRRAHLLMPDLTESTYGWGHFDTEPERAAALRTITRLLAQFHAFWMEHPALRGAWGWDPRGLCAEAAAFARSYGGPHAPAVQRASEALPELLRSAPRWTLAHGDLHAGQVLWPRDGSAPLLIDYGQAHASLPGEDLAHLLAVRLPAAERARYGPGLRESYWAELAGRGWNFSAAEKAAQEQAGVALNLLSTARQNVQEPGEGVSSALENVAGAWAELS